MPNPSNRNVETGRLSDTTKAEGSQSSSIRSADPSRRPDIRFISFILTSVFLLAAPASSQISFLEAGDFSGNLSSPTQITPALCTGVNTITGTTFDPILSPLPDTEVFSVTLPSARQITSISIQVSNYVNITPTNSSIFEILFSANGNLGSVLFDGNGNFVLPFTLADPSNIAFRINVGARSGPFGFLFDTFDYTVTITTVGPEIDGPNAQLRLLGQIASDVDPASHSIPLQVPGVLTAEIDSGANVLQPFILLAKVECPGSPPSFVPRANPTPFGAGGGSIDMTLDGVEVVLNGFAPGVLGLLSKTGTSGVFGLNAFAPCTLAGKKISFQAIVADPSGSGGPFMLDNTELASVFFDPCVTTIAALGDDDFVEHALNFSIDYYTQSFSSVFINSNGFLTFDHGSTDFEETLADFFGGFGGGPNPVVASYFSDLNRDGENSGASYRITEDSAADTVEVVYENQNHWSSQEPAGSFSVLFDNLAGTVTFDYSGFLPGTMAIDDGIFGVSDGTGFLGNESDLSDGAGTGISSQLGIYTSFSSFDSIGEVIPMNTPFGSSIYVFTDLNGQGMWSIN